MRFLILVIAVVLAAAECVTVLASNEGLVAYYNFDEGTGSIAHDLSGNGNDGQIHGARFLKRERGFCLEFDGLHDFVDCGSKASLDLRNEVTLEAWVFPSRRVKAEPGILGKHFESYLLSYYADGQCWWYVSSGGNHAKSLLTPGSWHHVAGTFDGKMIKLYVDGQVANASPSKFAAIKPGKSFFIGCVVGDPNATDPSYARTTFFPGQIDEVRVYNRALSEEEVRSHFKVGANDLSLAARFQPVSGGEMMRCAGASVRVGRHGQVQVQIGNECCLVESAYSYPDERIAWNLLSGTEGSNEPDWRPRVKRISSRVISIEAHGRFYSLRRVVTTHADRIVFEDTLTNRRSELTGLILRTSLTAPSPFEKAFTPGGAENPTLYAALHSGALGVLAEDNLSRLRFEPSLGLPANQASFQIGDFALDAGKSYTVRWTLYLLPQGASYFDFVNRVRRDWGGNFTLAGPFSFFDIGEMRDLLEQPEKLKTYLERKRLGVVGLSPWLDYDPGTSDRVWPRQEYKDRMQRAMRVLKAAGPNLKCVGCIETDWVTIYPERIKNGGKLPRYNTGSGLLNAEQTRILEEANLPWRDSLKRKADGSLELELYLRGGQPQTSLSVFPAFGNYQHHFLLDQIKFLIDEVGLDGFYIDEFNQAWRGGIPSYDGWDGLSAEIDPRTGKILRQYVDCSLAGIKARADVAQYALRRGKIVIANTYATAREEQRLPINRFSETQGAFDPFAAANGAEPPEVPFLYRGALASPIGLGILGAADKEDTACRIMKALVTYLRHGMLYYHYAIKDIPETGAGSGEYGPINHMFPITPIALHEGWIEGRERIITCVSGHYNWPHEQKPLMHLFDLDGRNKDHSFTLERTRQGWSTRLDLRDWAEIAVIEAAHTP